MTMGKIAIMMEMAILGSVPVPSQITNSGASATFGTAFSDTSTADRMRSSSFE